MLRKISCALMLLFICFIVIGCGSGGSGNGNKLPIVDIFPVNGVIYFYENTEYVYNQYLWKINADGTNFQETTTYPDIPTILISPNGQLRTYFENDTHDLVVIDWNNNEILRNSNIFNILKNWSDMAWDPNSQNLYFEGRQNNQDGLFRINLNGQIQRCLNLNIADYQNIYDHIIAVDETIIALLLFDSVNEIQYLYFINKVIQNPVLSISDLTPIWQRNASVTPDYKGLHIAFGGWTICFDTYNSLIFDLIDFNGNITDELQQNERSSLKMSPSNFWFFWYGENSQIFGWGATENFRNYREYNFDQKIHDYILSPDEKYVILMIDDGLYIIELSSGNLAQILDRPLIYGGEFLAWELN